MSEKIYSVPAEEIVVDQERIRKEFNQRDLQELADSFEKVGQIQPGVCIEIAEGKYKLIAGERRLRACKLAKRNFEFRLKEDIGENDNLLKIIELEENIVRVDLTWREKANALAMLHEAYQGRGWNRHTIEDTADRIGKSKGFVSEEIELAMWAREISEVGEAKQKSEAKKIVKRLKEELKRQEALEEAMTKSWVREKEEEEEEKGETGASRGKDRSLSEKELLEFKLQEYDNRILHGLMEDELEKFPNDHFDIVLFDPPWGVDFDQVRYTNGSTKHYSDSTVDFEQKLEEWLSLIYKKMSEHSHLFMFFAIVRHGFVYELLQKLGFSTNKIPYIWHKRGAHHTRNPDQWPGRSYEPIAYARKGSKDLQLKGSPDVIITPMPTPKIKQDHPSAKHPQIYKELLERSALPGDKVIDPMCGSGMAGVACESMRAGYALDWHMIEQDKTFRDLALFNVYKGYEKIIGDYGKPAPTKGSFRELIPGTEEWKEYWNTYPEDQEEMLKWKKELKATGQQ